jgi:hypothetical protein
LDIAIGIVVGLVAGVFVGMLGIGGGAILIPGMVLLMDVEQHTAQGVSLAVIAATALLGAITHYRQGNVRLRVALWIAPAAILFSFFGGTVADWISGSLLRQILGGIIIAMGIYMVAGDLPWWRKWLGRG